MPSDNTTEVTLTDTPPPGVAAAAPARAADAIESAISTSHDNPGWVVNARLALTRATNPPEAVGEDETVKDTDALKDKRVGVPEGVRACVAVRVKLVLCESESVAPADAVELELRVEDDDAVARTLIVVEKLEEPS